MTHLRLSLLSLSLMGLAYVGLGPTAAAKAAFVYFPLWGLTEFVHWVKVREDARCRICDFDPLLYHRDWRAARMRIETRMNQLSKEMQERIQAKVRQLEAQRTPPSPPPPSQ